VEEIRKSWLITNKTSSKLRFFTAKHSLSQQNIAIGYQKLFCFTTGQILLLVFRMALAFMDKIQVFMVTNKITKLQNAAERNK